MCVSVSCHIDVCSDLSSQWQATFCRSCDWRWNMVLSVWSWKQGTKFTMEIADILHTPIKLTCQNHRWRQCSLPFLYQGSDHFELIPQGHYVEILKQLHEGMSRKGLNFVPVIGFSTIITLQLTRHSLSCNFWPKNRLLIWKTHPVPLIWLWMNFGCFQN